MPLLFESGMDRGFDATIAVIADEEMRDARAAARGHEALAERGARQLTQEEKSQRATYTVRNDGDRRPSSRPSCRRSLTCWRDEPSDGHARRAGPAARAGGRSARRRVAAPPPRARSTGAARRGGRSRSIVAIALLPLAKQAVNEFSLPLRTRT